jgi:predicted TIM-barrel fold metal-dependent hydrolase
VHLDTSILYSGAPGWALRQVLERQVGLEVLERSLPQQVLFGSNYPRADIRRSVRGLEALPLSPALRERISEGNAAELLGLKGRP